MSDHQRTPTHGAQQPADLPTISSIDLHARGENFSVASRLLPRQARGDLMAIYGVARLIDEIGDEYEGDRLAALDWVERDLEAAADGRAVHPVIARVGPTIVRRRLELGPFRDLIDANRRDQRQHRYASFDELLEYCRLSANPVGRLVLAVFEIEAPHAVALSDRVCSGLQVVEHLQDVGEDYRAGRVYLPQEDLRRFGCGEEALAADAASPALQRVVALEVQRARDLLAGGDELVPLVPGRGGVAVAGFVAGGRAALDAIAAADHDVLGRPCRPSRRSIARHVLRLVTGRPPRPRHAEELR